MKSVSLIMMLSGSLALSALGLTLSAADVEELPSLDLNALPALPSLSSVTSSESSTASLAESHAVMDQVLSDVVSFVVQERNAVRNQRPPTFSSVANTSSANSETIHRCAPIVLPLRKALDVDATARTKP